MRKFVVVSCCALLALAGMASADPWVYDRDGGVDVRDGVREREFVKGDVNRDGVVDIHDVLLLVSFADGLVEPKPWQVIVGDMTGDGRITREDAALLLADVDPAGKRFAIRFYFADEPDGFVTSASDILAELRDDGEMRALHAGDMSVHFDLQYQGCPACGTDPNCATSYDRQLRVDLTVDGDLDGEICNANAQTPTVFNATHVNYTQTWGDFPLQGGESVLIVQNLTLTTCSTFGSFFDVTGLHCSDAEGGCNAERTACVGP